MSDVTAAVQAPGYAFDNPRQAYVLTAAHALQAQTTHPKRATTKARNFWRKVAWSPDGTHLLAQSEDHYIDLFRLDKEEDASNAGTTASGNGAHRLTHVFALRAPSTLLALEWYPFAQYAEPATWCFAFSARDVPVRLIDAYTGQTRASYGIQDHTERFVGPSSLAFSLDGTRLYCGHDRNITVFDLSRPGVNTYTYSMALAPSHNVARCSGLSGGQRGTISCLAVAPDHFSGSKADVLAVGTFSGSIGLYAMMNDGQGTEGELKDATYVQSICLAGWRENPATGITQLSFHPAGPHILFVASRRSHHICAYDLQYIGKRKTFSDPAPDVALIALFTRGDDCAQSNGKTQQRLYFALDWAGRFLVSGSASGQVKAWDVNLPGTIAETESGRLQSVASFFGKIRRSDDESAQRDAIASWKGADDAVAGISLHPHLRLLCCASGARHWSEASTSDDSDDDSDVIEQMHTSDASIKLFQL